MKMDYMDVMLHDLVKAGRTFHYENIVDALQCVEDAIKYINIIDYKSVKNEKTIKMLNILFKGTKKNDYRRHILFNNLMRIFFAKYVFIYDLPINDDVLNCFKSDFLG